MSKTYMSLTVGFTVWDEDHLPEDTDTGTVCEEIRGVVAEALAAWYADGGDKLVACEPIC